MLNLKGRTAVVTGAAGGIGRAIATSLARRGCNLALADINDEALERTAAEIAAAPGVRISKHHLDVSDRDAVAAFPDRVTAEHTGVDVLVNNAGVALAGTFEQISETDFEWLFGINFWGVVGMTRAFLPLLHQSDDARIVNLSSIFGIIAPPGNTAYSASKFAVRGFSESLAPRASENPHRGDRRSSGGRSHLDRPQCADAKDQFSRRGRGASGSRLRPSSPCRPRLPARPLSAVLKSEKRVFWSVPMLKCWH